MLAEPAELLAVELSSFQLHWAPSLRPEAGVVLNVAEDHLDWHGSMEAYARDKARALHGRVAVVGLDDPVAAGLLDDAAASVRVGFRLGAPAAGELGVRDGALVDRAFADADGLALADTASIPVPGPVGVLDALAAAALARAVGVPAGAIAAALAAFQLGAHRAAGRRPRSTASRTSTTRRPPTRTRRTRRSPPTRGWCGSPAACSRAPRSTSSSPRWRIAWSVRC